jgi:hypothetical protein
MMVSLFILIIFHTAYYFQVSLLVYYLQEPRCLKPEAVTVVTNEDVRINQYMNDNYIGFCLSNAKSSLILTHDPKMWNKYRIYIYLQGKYQL